MHHEPEEYKQMTERLMEYEALDCMRAYIKDSETSGLVVLWAYLSGAAALMGRHLWVELGTVGRLYANMFIIISGESHAKKTTALNLIRNIIIKNKLPVIFAPDDVSGSTKALMTAMLSMQELLQAQEEAAEAKKKADVTEGLFNTGTKSADDIFGGMTTPENKIETLDDYLVVGMDSNMAGSEGLHFDFDDLLTEDFNSIYCIPDELATLLTTKGVSMGKFLTSVYNGGAYTYASNGKTRVIHRPLANLIGTTQPSVLEAILNEQVLKDGFVGRTVFVWAPTTGKVIPFPPESSPVFLEGAGEGLRYVTQIAGKLELTDEAKAEYTKLYSPDKVYVNDPRFLNYNAKRSHHLLKIAMVLCAIDKRMTIELKDIQCAHELLLTVEPYMSKCLGYFGQGKEAPLLNEMVRYFEVLYGDANSKNEVTTDTLLNKFSHLADSSVIISALQLLKTKGIIVETVDPNLNIPTYLLNTKQLEKERTANA